MHSVGELAAEATKNAPRFEGVDARDVEAPPDACGCYKPADCWGNGGHHFRRYSQIDIAREVDNALAKLPQGSGDTDRKMVERDVNLQFMKYLGLHVAYERCPAYFAVVSDEARQRRAAGTSSGDNRRARMLGDL